MSPPPEPFTYNEQSRWFAEEVLPHEQPLRAYLRQSLSSRADVDDLVQHCFARILRVKDIGTVRSLPRASADVAAEYRLNRKVAVFITGRNVNKVNEDSVRYGPSTPRDRIISGRINYGATWHVGVKGTY